MNKIEELKNEYDEKMGRIEVDMYDEFNMRVGLQKAYFIQKVDEFLITELRTYYDQLYEVEKGKFASDYEIKLKEMQEYVVSQLDTFLNTHKDDVLQAASVGNVEKILAIRQRALDLIGAI